MNELPISVFEILLIIDLIAIAYSLYGINFDKPTTLDKILTSVITSPLSFILSTHIINGNVVQTYADSTGYHYVPFQSLPVHYFLLGFAVLMTILSVLLIIKFISDHFETLEKKSALGDWKENSFTQRR
jgi:hypothetical protein